MKTIPFDTQVSKIMVVLHSPASLFSKFPDFSTILPSERFSEHPGRIPERL
jgi:hypothetical protein